MAWSRSQLLSILALIFTLLVNSQCHARSLRMEPKEMYDPYFKKSDHLAMPKRVLASKTDIFFLGVKTDSIKMKQKNKEGLKVSWQFRQLKNKRKESVQVYVFVYAIDPTDNSYS